MAEFTTFTHFSGRRKDGTMVPGVMPQFDGSVFASGNCAAASEAVRDIVENAGGPAPGSPWQPTGASIRAGSGDHVGGLMPTQTAAVSWAHYRIESDIRIVQWDVVRARLRERFGVTLLVSYRPISAAGESGSPGFLGNHSIFLLGIRGSGASEEIYYTDSLRDGRRKGIPMGPKWIKASVLKAAAAALILKDGLTLAELRGTNKAYVSFTITPYVPPKPPKPGVTLRFKATKMAKPRQMRVIFDRTNLRSQPRKRDTNVARVINRGFLFNAYQRVTTVDGHWIGNKDGTRWLFRSGVRFVKYL